MIIPPGYAGISVPLNHVGIARTAYLTFGVKNNAGGTSAASVANPVFNALTQTLSLASILDSEVTIGPVKAAIGQDGSPPLSGEGANTQAGALSTGTLPSNCAVLVKKSTALGGRAGRGRIFIPWAIGESFVDEGGIITAGNVTTMQTAMSNMLSGLATNNVPMVILHAVSTGLPPLVVSLTVDRLLATQRRRLGRR
jgi:hypothetical protein